eukprot:TRINITY_DN5351_c0_g1_i1.p2 TRINITY_DN5351_c0_g1~~TRINITY_DN5351_c0_g1_i1.p2  ORF type:complete len:136 (-),score=56.13 TRINITY_DN5351_c0_g1_i1:81-437(-)
MSQVLTDLEQVLETLREIQIKAEDFKDGTQEDFNLKINQTIDYLRSIDENAEQVQFFIPAYLIRHVDEGGNPGDILKQKLAEIQNNLYKLGARRAAAKRFADILDKPIVDPPSDAPLG